MNCVICRQGELEPGETTITLERGSTVVVFRNVPAEICQNCGEALVNEEVTDTLLKKAEEAASDGVEVDIRQFTAA